MKNFFDGCSTVEEIKARYKALAKKYHPDLGGDTATMQEINRQYENAFNAAKSGHTYTQGTAQTTEETAQDFINIINHLIKIQGITVELCGSWIWISGDTKPCKDELKAAGCRWASKKKMWYWHMGGYHRGHNATMDHIRAKYGSRVFTGANSAAMATA